MIKHSDITVAICTFNGAQRITECLIALSQQSDDFSILVVDDGSTDGTVATVRQALEQLDLICQVVELPENVGIWAARQAAVDACQTDIIAFIDDDCRPTAAWAHELLEAWQSADATTHLIGGPTTAWRPTSRNARYNDVFNTILPLDRRFGQDIGLLTRVLLYIAPPRVESMEVVSYLAAANLSARVASIKAVGGFPAIRGAGEDTYLCDTIRRTYGPESIWSVPQLLVEHDYGDKLRGTWRRSKLYGRGAAQKWIDKGGIPSLRPGPPFLLGVVILLGLLTSPWIALGTLLVTPYLFWLPSTLKRTHHLTDWLTFPMFRFADESLQVVGFASVAWRKFFKAVDGTR
jgi:glycosyltransferase involved in cell wall biosynthesis